MSINYDFYSARQLKGARGELYARTVGGQRYSTDDLAVAIERGTTASRADIRLVLDALAREMTWQLRSGNTVSIDGLGTFSVAMKGDIDRDRTGRLLLKNAAVKTVRFRPCRELRNGFRGVEFTRSRHLGIHSAAVTEEQMMAVARRLCEEDIAFSARRFRYELGLTKTTAWERLQRLVEAGKLQQIGGRRFALYALPQEAKAEGASADAGE